VTFKDVQVALSDCECQQFGFIDLGVGIGGGTHWQNYQFRVNALTINGVPYQLTFDEASSGGDLCFWRGEIPCDIDLWGPRQYDDESEFDGTCASDPAANYGVNITAVQITLIKSRSTGGATIRVMATARNVPVIYRILGVNHFDGVRDINFPHPNGFFFGVAGPTSCFEDTLICNTVIPYDQPYVNIGGESGIPFGPDFGLECHDVDLQTIGIGDGCALIKTTSDEILDMDCSSCGFLPFMQARDCHTGELIDVWMFTWDALGRYASFHVIGSSPVICGYFDPADTPTLTLGGTYYSHFQVSPQRGCGNCPEYRQARRCDTGELGDVWMGNLDALLAGVFYLPTAPYDCFRFDASDPTHDAPGGTMYSPETVVPSLFPCNRCPGYLQALKCSDNSPVDWWMKLPEANAIGFNESFTVNTGAGGDGVTCYHFRSGETIEAIPGTLIDPTTDITLRGPCSDCLKYCYAEFICIFSCTTNTWGDVTLSAMHCYTAADAPPVLDTWDVGSASGGVAAATYWRKLDTECQADGDCPEDAGDPPSAPIVVPGGCEPTDPGDCPTAEEENTNCPHYLTITFSGTGTSNWDGQTFFAFQDIDCDWFAENNDPDFDLVAVDVFCGGCGDLGGDSDHWYWNVSSEDGNSVALIADRTSTNAECPPTDPGLWTVVSSTFSPGFTFGMGSHS
jgi:hypothetical protein